MSSNGQHGDNPILREFDAGLANVPSGGDRRTFMMRSAVIGAAAVITDKGEGALICEGFARDAALIKDTTSVKEIRSSEALSQTCVQYLKEKKLIPSTIGFAGLRQHMPYREFEIVSEATRGCRIVDADDIVNRMRVVKSVREIDQVRRSARLVARLFDSLARHCFSTFTERAVEAVVYRLGYLEGAEDVRILIAGPQGKKVGALRPPDDRTISGGDTIIIHLAVEFERYWAEGTRTFRSALLIGRRFCSHRVTTSVVFWILT